MSIIDSIIRKKTEGHVWPLVHVRDTVIFPGSISPLLALTKSSICAVHEAQSRDKKIFVSLLKREATEHDDSNVYNEGTLCRIIQEVKQSDGTIRLLIEGEQRGVITNFHYRKDFIHVAVNLLVEDEVVNPEISVLMLSCQKSFLQYSEYYKKLPHELIVAIERADSPNLVCNLITHAILIKPERKQIILANTNTIERLTILLNELELELESLALQKKVNLSVKSRIDKNQKEYYLKEQLKEIQKELGKNEEDLDDAALLKKAIASKNPPPEVLEKTERELIRLSKLQPISPEAGILRTYLEWISDLPWSNKSEDKHDLKFAENILNEDHYALDKAKNRILEYIAVHSLNEDMKGSILCFNGPPGTGKTSLGRSVARALNREFVRISLGGIRDEAEIRGHRKTYVGALPGKIIQSMKKAKTSNPVFLLDEIDKMSNDFHGDPASALLEVLDPEQNTRFVDHYLEVPYDLSKVLFITTANSISTIAPALLDRMEVIEIPGYSEYEKLEIANQFIIPKLIKENGLGLANIVFKKDAIQEIIRNYTMESGLRGFEREIDSIIRKIAIKALEANYNPKEENAEFSYTVHKNKIEEFLGKKKTMNSILYNEPRIGVSNGLAWTQGGGTLLPVEAVSFEGKGELILTGNLGDVMKESARAAVSFLRSNAKLFKPFKIDVFKSDIHIHVPEGAIPKDGPSAGITIAAALTSLFLQVPLKALIAMTGEITLSGRILPVGGVKEKLLAAHRNGVLTIILPKENERDYNELPEEVKKDLKIILVDSIIDACKSLFESNVLKEKK